MILLEASNTATYVMPVMIATILAAQAGNMFNHGLFDMHIRIKCVPFLEHAPDEEMRLIRAIDVMNRPEHGFFLRGMPYGEMPMGLEMPRRALRRVSALGGRAKAEMSSMGPSWRVPSATRSRHLSPFGYSYSERFARERNPRSGSGLLPRGLSSARSCGCVAEQPTQWLPSMALHTLGISTEHSSCNELTE